MQEAPSIAEMPIAPRRDREPVAARVPRSWQGETKQCRNPQFVEVLWAVGLRVYCGANSVDSLALALPDTSQAG